MVYRPDQTADYSGVQVISATLGGKEGSFALLVRGKYDGKKAVAKWEVVPDAGEDGLKGLTGKREYSGPRGSKGRYKLILPDAAQMPL
ncbi:MAG: hypothetical protein NVS1B3_02770 [Candidatus Dormibacteraceae bacterium]